MKKLVKQVFIVGLLVGAVNTNVSAMFTYTRVADRRRPVADHEKVTAIKTAVSRMTKDSISDAGVRELIGHYAGVPVEQKPAMKTLIVFHLIDVLTQKIEELDTVDKVASFMCLCTAVYQEIETKLAGEGAFGGDFARLADAARVKGTLAEALEAEARASALMRAITEGKREVLALEEKATEVLGASEKVADHWVAVEENRTAIVERRKGVASQIARLLAALQREAQDAPRGDDTSY